jgi:AraC-like DNA-binding protein
MLLFLSLSGTILSLILLVFNAKRYKSSRYLGGFFFLVSVYALHHYVFVDSHSVLSLTIFFVHPGFLFYLIGPSLFWYVRSVLTDKSHLRRQDLWHLLPAFIYLISAIPYLFLSWDEKTANAALLASDIGNLKYIRASLLYSVLPPAMVYISRPLLVTGYAVLSSVIFIRWLKNHKNRTVLSHQQYMIPWLTVLLGFVFILSISQLLAMTEAYLSHNLKVFLTLRLLHLFSGIGLTGLLISPLFFPSILYGMPRVPATRPAVAPPGPGMPAHSDPLSPVPEETPKPGFEADYLEEIGSKMDECMQKLQPYLQNDCNLAYMAKLTGIPAHHLAYYFREDRRQPFNEYRNIWRVHHAKNLMREGKTKELTLEAIGLLSGFSTRNTFYSAFRKIEGSPPSAFVDKECENKKW